MATTFPLVFAPDDERQFFTFLEPFGLTLYPELVPPRWKPIPVNPAACDLLDEPAYYLAAEALAPVQIDVVKRGKNRGLLMIDETQSPVIHYERSVFDEDGALRSGRLWTWADFTGDARRDPAFPEHFRRMWLQIHEYLKTKCHRSQPAGWVVGPHAARLAKAGTVLRESGHKGVVLKSYR